MSEPRPAPVTVAVVATTPTLGAVRNNIAVLADTMCKLSGIADLLVLPELFATGYHLTELDLAAAAEPLDGQTVTELCDLARANSLALIGAVLEADGRAVYDTALVVDRRGQLVTSYRKTHLHPSEAGRFTQGDELVVAEIDSGLRIGLAICVEHAYPEIFTELALAGAQLVAVPAAVRASYGYLLELRTRARAQDNQLFVATANFAGDDGHTAWCGGSMIVDPRGTVLTTTADSAGWAIAELDLSRQLREREQEPVLARRRPELYARLRTTTPVDEATASLVSGRDFVERTVP